MEWSRLESHHQQAVTVAALRGVLPAVGVGPLTRVPRDRVSPLVALLTTCLQFLLGAAALPVQAGGDAAIEAAEWLSRPWFEQATWGVKVMDAANGEVIFATNAQRLLKPASTAKLFTAALALDQLGPSHEVRTEILADARPSNRGTLKGDLLIRGRGDGTFCERMRPGVRGPGVLAPFVAAIREAGIRRIFGDLVLDDGFIEGGGVPTGWIWDDLQYYYGACPAALVVHEGRTDLIVTSGAEPGDPVVARFDPPVPGQSVDATFCRTLPPGSVAHLAVDRRPSTTVLQCFGGIPAGGVTVTQSVAVLDPVRWFGAELLRALEDAGIRVRGRLRVESGAADRLTQGNSATLMRWGVPSRRVGEWVRVMMKPSQNLQAQLLFLQCAADFEGTPDSGREAGGVRALAGFLGRQGLPTNQVCLDEGSGLSRSALVTPEVTLGLLRAMDRHPAASEFLDSLPVAGVDGTLRARLRGTPLAGNLRAKTGSMRYVSALAGFVTNSAGRRLVFSVMLNAYQPPPGGPTGREAIDELMRRLAGAPVASRGEAR